MPNHQFESSIQHCASRRPSFQILCRLSSWFSVVRHHIMMDSCLGRCMCSTFLFFLLSLWFVVFTRFCVSINSILSSAFCAGAASLSRGRVYSLAPFHSNFGSYVDFVVIIYRLVWVSSNPVWITHVSCLGLLIAARVCSSSICICIYIYIYIYIRFTNMMFGIDCLMLILRISSSTKQPAFGSGSSASRVSCFSEYEGLKTLHLWVEFIWAGTKSNTSFVTSVTFHR